MIKIEERIKKLLVENKQKLSELERSAEICSKVYESEAHTEYRNGLIDATKEFIAELEMIFE